jgi:hypothetical protein
LLLACSYHGHYNEVVAVAAEHTWTTAAPKRVVYEPFDQLQIKIIHSLEGKGRRIMKHQQKRTSPTATRKTRNAAGCHRQQAQNNTPISSSIDRSSTGVQVQ